MSCEEGCFFFQTLSPDDRRFNRGAREVTLMGKEVDGSIGSMCGSCVQIERNTSYLDEQIALFAEGLGEERQE